MELNEKTANEVAEYIYASKFNYVIIEKGGTPLCWTNTDDPIIYGSKEEAEDDMQKGDKLITEYKYLMNRVAQLEKEMP